MKSMSRHILLASAALLALAACRGKQAAAPEKDERPKGGNRAIVVSTESQTAISLRLEKLQVTSMPETLTVVGRILQDAQTCHHIPAKAAGTVHSVAVSLGQKVAKGETLAVLKNRAGEETPVASDYSGVVTAAHADPGDSVDDGMFLFSVTEVDPLWGVLDIHERNLAKIRVGQSVEIRTAAYPDSVSRGKIIFVSPEIDSVTRTVKARVSIANPDGRLKLGMFLDASIRLDSGSRGLFVPRGAVQTVPEGSIVFVQSGPNEFRPAPVSLGREQDEWVQVLDGLKAGDIVAFSGSFMLKSEMLKDQLEGDEH
jgi:cobalt-zinc-cadmium efflux system membrane fusion protein